MSNPTSSEPDERPARTSLVTVASEAARAFFDHQPFQLAGALSYYTLLAIAPLLLVITGVAALLLGEEAVRETLIEQARDLIGEEGASLTRTVLANADRPGQGWISIGVGGVLVFFGATTVFAQLQIALNRIWHVEAAPANAVIGFLRHRLLSFSIVLGIGFLLWASLLVTAALEMLFGVIAPYLPGSEVVWRALNALVSLGMVTLLLAVLFKYVPDAKIQWRDTWAGALVTALLFTIGKFGIGLYLGRAVGHARPGPPARSSGRARATCTLGANRAGQRRGRRVNVPPSRAPNREAETNGAAVTRRRARTPRSRAGARS